SKDTQSTDSHSAGFNLNDSVDAPSPTNGSALISIHQTGYYIATADFTTGTKANEFYVDGRGTEGRALAIGGGEMFYTQVFKDMEHGTSFSDAIHVVAYGVNGSGSHDLHIWPNPRPDSGIAGLSYFNDTL